MLFFNYIEPKRKLSADDFDSPPPKRANTGAAQGQLFQPLQKAPPSPSESFGKPRHCCLSAASGELPSSPPSFNMSDSAEGPSALGDHTPFIKPAHDPSRLPSPDHVVSGSTFRLAPIVLGNHVFDPPSFINPHNSLPLSFRHRRLAPITLGHRVLQPPSFINPRDSSASSFRDGRLAPSALGDHILRPASLVNPAHGPSGPPSPSHGVSDPLFIKYDHFLIENFMLEEPSSSSKIHSSPSPDLSDHDPRRVPFKHHKF